MSAGREGAQRWSNVTTPFVGEEASTKMAGEEIATTSVRAEEGGTDRTEPQNDPFGEF